MSALLTSCDNPTLHFKVDGMSGEFRVPKTGYVAPAVWFVPNDTVGTPQGFSFGGCHRLRQEDRAACTLPNEFISADVKPLSEKRNQIWVELKGAAIYEEIINKPGVEYSIDQRSGLLILSNNNVWKQWSVWKRGQTLQKTLPLSMLDDDELILACSKIEDFPRSAGLGSYSDYGCERFVRGSRYALQYRFVSKQRVPVEAELKALESALFEQVDKWYYPN
jgi:hypothetical protein